MDIVPSLWVSTYYCILGWHLVITKNQKIFFLLILLFQDINCNSIIILWEMFWKISHRKFFFSCGRTVTKQTLRHLWRVLLATLIGRAANTTHPNAKLHVRRSMHSDLRGNCLTGGFSYSQASMADTCYSRCLLLHFFI